uniref:Developmentally regulated GTP binding protein 1 n=1 Tax=Astyanax mexicanus TaxID=7994 RepID=A0A8B9L1Q0_ASTMX
MDCLSQLYEMARTQKNKATAHHLGLLKARLAKLRRELITPKGGFDVAKTGDARIGFVGFPSVGKSTLLSNLAGVYSEVAAYEFTTLTTVPGVIPAGTKYDFAAQFYFGYS